MTSMPRELPAVLLESFQRNGRVNAAMLDAITEADLDLSDGQGGMSVGQHLEHLAGMRRYWVGRVSPAHAEAMTFTTQEADQRFWTVTLSPAELREAFSQGDAAALEAVQSAYAEGRSFTGVYESDPAHFLQHTIVHDAHHRGQVMNLLRRGGRSLEQMDALEQATWPIWKE
ncbi:putative DinB family protein [Deinococcus aerius]|uniref:Putative DinB family protein n=1 Tax=Deinococcus aerius TaxID=200253 RepID=A0A2I9DSL4_9DEIO|nr:DinB family protein [Deinococcus aerius]GBF05487.1 putative DinB family protein [Deinococcus aerius]